MMNPVRILLAIGVVTLAIFPSSAQTDTQCSAPAIP